ncbi:hypothetical protein L5515_007832 [Caenorhabditis briggsae]|uniref:Uncharacterized protein n=1 Tax=Caenorhabditis briggsae TaxID=6238 RepID=A0AAE9F488_CAEBR|nr:hypothetical protein L5515_007832 [Caenorhabditis briggsae]
MNGMELSETRLNSVEPWLNMHQMEKFTVLNSQCAVIDNSTQTTETGAKSRNPIALQLTTEEVDWEFASSPTAQSSSQRLRRPRPQLHSTNPSTPLTKLSPSSLHSLLLSSA